jgi:hypothetical protein
MYKGRNITQSHDPSELMIEIITLNFEEEDFIFVLEKGKVASSGVLMVCRGIFCSLTYFIALDINL